MTVRQWRSQRPHRNRIELNRGPRLVAVMGIDRVPQDF
jgi:hypothetical protein